MYHNHTSFHYHNATLSARDADRRIWYAHGEERLQGLALRSFLSGYVQLIRNALQLAR